MKYENLTWEQFKDKLAQNPENKKFLGECEEDSKKISSLIEERIKNGKIHINGSHINTI